MDSIIGIGIAIGGVLTVLFILLVAALCISRKGNDKAVDDMLKDAKEKKLSDANGKQIEDEYHEDPWGRC